MGVKTSRRPGSFVRRLMALQFGLVAVVIGLCVAAAAWQATARVHDHAEREALAIARTVAADDGLRRAVADQAQLEDLDEEALRAGPLQAGAEDVRSATGALFVVVTEDRGYRLSHPNPAEIGRLVSTDPAALGGEESVSLERGTLGESVRAKVPVFAPGAGPDAGPGAGPAPAVVGEVSLGLAVDRVSGEVRAAVLPVLGVGAGALLLGALGTAALVRRLRRLTLGLEPEDMSQLLRDQEAVLYGVDDGVIGIGPDHRISVRNRAARELLGVPRRTEPGDIVGRDYRDAGLPAGLVRAIADRVPGPLRLPLGDHVVVARVREVRRGGSELGVVVMLRDLTAMESLGTKLDAVEAMAGALRVQRHEFANRLHTLSGLLENGAVDDARSYLGEVITAGPVREPVENLAAVHDTYLRAFLGAKGVQAHERGVALRVGEGTALFGRVADAQDVTAVLGNLVDNAVTAAVAAVGPEDAAAGPPWVEVDLLSEGGTLHVAVADSGGGVPEGLDVFADGATTALRGGDAAHGHGVGLTLARRLARQRGGDVWLADPGRPPGLGAVFCARLPQVLTTDEERR